MSPPSPGIWKHILTSGPTVWPLQAPRETEQVGFYQTYFYLTRKFIWKLCSLVHEKCSVRLYLCRYYILEKKNISSKFRLLIENKSNLLSR